MPARLFSQPHGDIVDCLCHFHNLIIVGEIDFEKETAWPPYRWELRGQNQAVTTTFNAARSHEYMSAARTRSRQGRS
jgi:hypothetical protein